MATKPMAYRIGPSYFCVECAPLQAQEIVRVDDLYDVDCAGDPPEYVMRWRCCASCDESLEPRDGR